MPLRWLRWAATAGAALALVWSPAASAAAGGNLVVNGSFESPVVSGPVAFFNAPSTALTGWTLSAGSVDLNTQGVWQPADGAQSLDLSGNGPGTIYQDLSTVPGESYTLAFAMSGNPYCGTETVQLRASWNGSVVSEPTFDTSVITAARTDMHYAQHQYTVQATGATTRLQFDSLTGSSCGPVIDAISVTNAYQDLCAAVQADSTKAGVAQSLCAKLSAADADALRGADGARAGVLGAFGHEIDAQSGKAFTAAQAVQLEAQAAAL